MRIMAKAKIVYMEQELLDQLKALSAQRHESVSAIIRQTLRDNLPRVEGNDTAKPPALAEGDKNDKSVQ